MTANKRIIINILATYSRSLFSLVCGLLTGRWVLMALGEVDYGLFGVIGGLTFIVSFFNDIFAGALGRFYAVSVGASHKCGEEESGLEACREWFNTAVLIHTVIPVLVVAVGYPLGIWAISNYLSIPTNRIEACIWVFRCVCVSCFIGMINVPFRAMYTAKQEIAEMTIYSFLQTLANFIFVYYMFKHPGDWLVGYVVGITLIAVVQQVLICVRACYAFPECRFDRRKFWLPLRIAELIKFVGAQFWASLTGLIQGQGFTIVVNKMLGPRFNASMTVGNTVTNQVMTLSSALGGAFSPAVMNAAGEGDFDRMRRMAFRACKFGAVLFLMFVIPAALEIDELLRLWLVNPPPLASLICVCFMAGQFAEKVTDGYSMAIFADGRIGVYQFWIGNACISSVFIASVLCYQYGMFGIGLAFIVLKTFVIVIRLVCGHRIVAMSSRHWLFAIFLPIFLLIGVATGVGLIPKIFFAAGLVRIIVTTILCELAFFPLVWYIVFDRIEREYFRGIIKRKLGLVK